MKINLSDTQLFRGISAEDINSMLSCLETTEKSFKKGETILQEGSTTEHIGLVLSGMVLIEHCDIWGTAAVLGSVAPGGVFAEAYACIPGEPLLIRAFAAEDTAVLFINISKILNVCSSACAFHSKLIGNLLTLCAAKSLELSRRIVHTGSKTIRGRLLSYFSECVKRSGSNYFDIPYNRQQLAGYLGVDRSAMSNELSKLRKEGIIEYDKNSFKVCKTDGLIC